MLNYETLLSNYDDKLTLMQWLKKVEAALKDASATAFNVNKKGSATISFEIVFEDGSKLESGDIVLQQGESVASAYISTGHLHLVLTNGDDLDAGELLNGDLNVNGKVTATGNVEAGGDIQANGALKGASAAVTGAVSGASGSFSGNVGAGGAITAAGAISSTAGSVSAAYALVAGTQVTTPKLTSGSAEIEAEKPIVEKMTGYSFTTPSPTGYTLDVKYAGMVKNGNKLTLSLALEITKTAEDGDYSPQMGTFNVPLTIADLLIPSNIGGYSFIDNRTGLYFEDHGTYVSAPIYMQKGLAGALQLQAYALRSILTINTPYFFRYEVTFLLSENLAA